MVIFVDKDVVCLFMDFDVEVICWFFFGFDFVLSGELNLYFVVDIGWDFDVDFLMGLDLVIVYVLLVWVGDNYFDVVVGGIWL